MMKNILGLDLGITSIGWAHIIEGNTPEESSIVQAGSRVVPLSIDERTNFEKGQPITTNAERTLARGARRNLDRFQQRRDNLIDVLRINKIIRDNDILAESGSGTTFETWRIRSKAASEKINKNEFARVLLAINKQRGYKSSRKVKNQDEGQLIDGMAIAKKMYDESLTPGQLSLQILREGKTNIQDYYRSDLQAEFDAIWKFQKQFHPKILTDEFYNELKGKNKKATSTLFWATYGFNTAQIKDIDSDLRTIKTDKLNKRQEKKLQEYKWRNDALIKELGREELAYALTEINNSINNSSGYLGAISDRSKELYFNKETVGQNQYKQLIENRHTSLKNQVFYRQDYLDEFETIWNEQSKHHPELTNELKIEIRDIIIFYQRKLKSQKGLISFCELESKQVEKNGVTKTIGSRVAPKSSPLFQEFKIWQILHNIEIINKGAKKRSKKRDTQSLLFNELNEHPILEQEQKQLLFDELNIKGNLLAKDILELLNLKSHDWGINYTQIEGNRTSKALYEAYLKIIDLEGYDTKELLNIKSSKDEIELSDTKTSAAEIKKMVKDIFSSLNINTDILEFDAGLKKKEFERQAQYQLWHMLYSYEGDDSASGNERLYKLLEKKFGFKREHAQILAQVALQDDYGNLSAKAMRNIYPYILRERYSNACKSANYNHSKNSITTKENNERVLKSKLELLPKNSLRNPVVEKILNQLVNVVNAIIDKENDKLGADNKPRNFHFDEIRIELARELKKNADERAKMTTDINAAKTAHEKIFKILQTEFKIKNPTRNDIIKYRLYEELKNNGYKDLYKNEYIPREKLFSKEIDIDHILPQSRLFDDSFSNKTVTYRETNIKKGGRTAFDFIEEDYGADVIEAFEQRIGKLHELGSKNKEAGISSVKHQKLLKKESEIGDGFIERDLRDSQYIAKKAKELLFGITRSVLTTTGSVTDRLREDWGLINIMKEINLPKYRALGLTEMQERKYGQCVEVIKDWTKRNDHRHHAMDAITIAFTKRSHIQYLNNLNARSKGDDIQNISNTGGNISLETSDLIISTRDVMGIEAKELYRDEDGKLKFKLPMPNFRQVAKEHLDEMFISQKAKNKVITRNKNKTKTAFGDTVKTELTPRGQLHKETIYGKYHFYKTKEEKVGTRFNEEMIIKVTNPEYRDALLKRLQENENDPKKAFGGKNAISKKPITINGDDSYVVPEIVKIAWLETDYSIRKPITPENFSNEKSLEKVIDKGIRDILISRLQEYGDAKAAFSDLDKNPIWLNKDKGIAIKRVAIRGISNAVSLHTKKDHLGEVILDNENKLIPTSFVSTGNNHHVAIYIDERGKLQEKVVSFYEAVIRANYNLPIIFKDPTSIIDKVIELNITEEVILEAIPPKEWKFLFTMKQNEMFVFPNEGTGLNPKEINLLDPKNKKDISPNLFRVQKFTIKDYFFRHHLETNVETNNILKGNTWKREGLNGILGIIKVRINHLGDVVGIGEY